jgi:lactate dehydrogenase-like 2-hydroxyacid dehydrogenase
LYSGNSRKPEAEQQFKAEFVSFDQLLAQSDMVLICCSLSSKTTNLFDARAFSLMKSNAILINTSRGHIVDEKALVDALKSGLIRGAGLDVMRTEPLPLDDPLLSLDNVVLLPHIGSASYETRLEMAKLTAENVKAGLAGGDLPGPVVQ